MTNVLVDYKLIKRFDSKKEYSAYMRQHGTSFTVHRVFGPYMCTLCMMANGGYCQLSHEMRVINGICNNADCNRLQQCEFKYRVEICLKNELHKLYVFGAHRGTTFVYRQRGICTQAKLELYALFNENVRSVNEIRHLLRNKFCQYETAVAIPTADQIEYFRKKYDMSRGRVGLFKKTVNSIRR